MLRSGVANYCTQHLATNIVYSTWSCCRQVSYLVSDVLEEDHEAFAASCQLWRLQQAVLDALPGQLPWLAAQLQREDAPLAAKLADAGLFQHGDPGPLHGWIAALFCGLLPPSSVSWQTGSLLLVLFRIKVVIAFAL